MLPNLSVEFLGCTEGASLAEGPDAGDFSPDWSLLGLIALPDFSRPLGGPEGKVEGMVDVHGTSTSTAGQSLVVVGVGLAPLKLLEH